MLCINTLTYIQLKNAEHVSFFSNIALAINTLGVEDLGLNTALFSEYKNAVDAEQDIVLKAQGSMYTADMKAADEERDALYIIIHHKLQAMAHYPASSVLSYLKAPLEKYILNKYGTSITALPYQEESAHLAGFDLDMHTQFSDDDFETMGITTDLLLLKAANDRFAAMYNQRATERSGNFSEETKLRRTTSENLFARIKLYLEYTVDSAPETDKGILCAKLIGVINEIVRDARMRINQRLGKSPVDDGEEEPSGESGTTGSSSENSSSSSSGDEPGLDDNISPIPYPKD